MHISTVRTHLNKTIALATACLSLCGMLTATATHAVEANAQVKAAVVLKTQTSWDGKPLVYPQGTAELTAMTVEIAPGGETGWHKHPMPSFGVILEGELRVALKNGQAKKVHAGEVLAEVVDTFHNGRNLGTVPVKLVVFYTGTVAQPTTIKNPVVDSPKPATDAQKY